MGKKRLRITLHCPFCLAERVEEIEHDDDDVILETCHECKKKPMMISRITVLGEA